MERPVVKRQRQGAVVVVGDDVDFSLVAPTSSKPATASPPPHTANVSGPSPTFSDPLRGGGPPRRFAGGINKRQVGGFGSSHLHQGPAAATDPSSAEAVDLFLKSVDAGRAAQERVEQCGEHLRTAAAQLFDLKSVLFQDGVPDVEPWDLGLVPHLGKYAPDGAVRSGNVSIGDTVFHPAAFSVIPVQAPAPTEFRLVKTQDELRAERRERLRQKAAQEAALKKSAANQQQQHKDKLSLNRVTTDQMPDFAINPLRADELVREEVNEREVQHLRRNYENKIAALPHQIMKKEVDAWHDATKNPTLQVFHVFPTSPEANDCVNRLRNFANEKDARMRGFVLWTGKTDLLIVLCGGEKPMRHVRKWIYQMRWGTGGGGNNKGSSTSASLPCEPVVTHVFSSRLSCLSEFSFHLPRRAAEDVPRTIEALKAVEQVVEPVFVKMVDHAREAEEFVRQQPSYGPLPSLVPLWRAAYGF